MNSLEYLVSVNATHSAPLYTDPHAAKRRELTKAEQKVCQVLGLSAQQYLDKYDDPDSDTAPRNTFATPSDKRNDSGLTADQIKIARQCSVTPARLAAQIRGPRLEGRDLFGDK